MPNFRTKKKDRPTYIYKDAYGRKVTELKPGEDGVTEAWIADLHAADDAVHNAAKRDSYHGVFHYEQDGIDGDELPGDRQADLADHGSNPETLFIKTLEAAERSGAFKKAWDGLTDNQRSLVMKKLLKRTNVDIGKEEGCSKEAIRNRLLKIQKKFEKFLI